MIMGIKLETTKYKGKKNKHWILLESRVFDDKLDLMIDAKLHIINTETMKEVIVDDVWEYEWEEII